MNINNGLNSITPEEPLALGNSVIGKMNPSIILLQGIRVIHISSCLKTPLQLANANDRGSK